MSHFTSKKGVIIRGAFILTLTGFLSRFIGFFYRVFLSQTFGEEGVGLYQLIFPIYALCYSLTVAGIETALSRAVASKVSLGKEQEAKQLLYVALGVSVFFSAVITCILQANASWAAKHILLDVRCAPLLVAMSYSFPFSAIHSCICGYCFGLKQTGIPAIAQLVEQTARVAAVYIIYLVALKKSFTIDITFAVLGLVFGEITSSFFCVKAFSRNRKKGQIRSLNFRIYRQRFRELIPMSVPLTANRILLNLLQSIEAISIPARLQMSGLNTEEALSIYGVLTGMALPCILFPSAITNSISTMMLPTVAEIQTASNTSRLSAMIRKVTGCCFLLGVCCCIGFLALGQWMGTFLFHSESAGKFIVTLAWICPFQYMNSTLISMVNGLGKTTVSFLVNSIGLLLRIGSVMLLIPVYGIIGYLWGLLGSQICVSLLCILYLSYYIRSSKKMEQA